MRFLIVDHYYDRVIDEIYHSDPDLAGRGYEGQRAKVADALFGQTLFEVDALAALGHDASDSLVNVRPLQEAWAREHGIRLDPPTRWGLRLRRGFVPWPGRHADMRWIGEVLLAQTRALRPDVIVIQSMDLLEPGLVSALRAETRIIVGMVATELPSAWRYDAYDLILSSIPDLVDRFRREGTKAEFLPLAFEPKILDMMSGMARDLDVSFAGSFSDRYADRTAIIEAVALIAPLSTWTGDLSSLPQRSPIRPTVRGSAWGRAMYDVLARSRLTINTHGRIAGNAANNLRLYEGTGMGALLVTDARDNLQDLFDVGREVVVYRTAQECAEVVRHYLANPAEADSIARAGQRRTLRDHRWIDRMARLIEMVEHRI